MKSPYRHYEPQPPKPKPARWTTRLAVAWLALVAVACSVAVAWSIGWRGTLMSVGTVLLLALTVAAFHRLMDSEES